MDRGVGIVLGGLWVPQIPWTIQALRFQVWYPYDRTMDLMRRPVFVVKTDLDLERPTYNLVSCSGSLPLRG